MKKNLQLIALFLLALLPVFAQAQTPANVLNDGRIRVRIWCHKVWCAADCSEVSGADPMLQDIQVRVPNNAAANTYDASPTGFGVYYQDAGTHRFLDMSSPSDTRIPSGVALQSPATQGYLLFDKTYTSTLAPSTFQWRIGEVFEKDACGGNFDYRGFNANPFSSSFCLDGDDAHNTSGTFFPIAGNIRSTPAGQVGYIYTDPGELIGTSSRDVGFATVFAFQWDWVDANPPLCSSPTYNDGNIQLDVQYLGTWSDSDYDGAAAFCTPGFAGDEELRVRYRTKDNLSAYSGWQLPVKQNQPEPGWNILASPLTILSKTYAPGTLNMQDFNIDFDAWEEDGCGGDDDYNTGCFNDDEDRVQTNKTINWRDSPPNVWNQVDVPLRVGTSKAQNWVSWVRYKWTIAAPTATLNGTFDRTLCSGTPTTITANTTSATYFQWQVADVTGPAGNTCPSGANWSDVAGANCKDFTPPQTPGTRIYRLKVMNRSASGSTANSGARLALAYSDCVRITYFPYSPPISSATAACGATVLGNTTHTFSFPAVPAWQAVANASSYSWAVTGPGTATIGTPAGNPSTSITFPSTPGAYTIILTTADACPSANAQSTCIITVTSPNCDFIYVAPAANGGNDVNNGSPDAPVASLNAAMALTSPTRKYVRMLEGTYVEGSKLIIPSNSIIIDGGYTLSGGIWTKNLSAQTLIYINSAEEYQSSTAHYIGIEAVSKNNWELRDLYIYVKFGGLSGTVSGTYNNIGKSIYGFRIESCTGFKIDRCYTYVGAGTNGANGTAGSNGSNGNNGSGGGNGSCDGSNGGGGAGGVSVGTGVRAGGAGGAGGGGGAEGNNRGADGTVGSAGGNGAAGSTGRGTGGNGSNRYISGFGCSGSGTASGGTSASPAGTAGGTGSPSTTAGTRPTTPTPSANFWTAQNNAANGGAGGGGGGGAGGGGGGGQGGSCVNDGGGNGAGGGGSGGQGGTGGTAGYPGGSAFAYYVYGGSGSYGSSITVVTGAGTGGTGGAAGTGGNGGSNGGGATNCTGEVGAGGNGSAGGKGGDGGRGQDGANGLFSTIQLVNGGVFTYSGAPLLTAALASLTTSYAKGCTNSEINITKASSAGSFSSYGTNGNIVNDITPSVSSFAAGSNSLNVFYTTTGSKDVSLAAPTAGSVGSLISITSTRSVPTISAASTVCSGGTITLDCTTNNPNNNVGFDWIIQEKASITTNSNPTPNYTFSVKTPGVITFTNNTTAAKTYQIRLKVRDECCGWSVPVYQDITVYPPLSANTIAAPSPVQFCTAGDPALIDGSTPSIATAGGSGTYAYTWLLDSGSGFAPISGSNVEDYNPSVLSTVGTYIFKRSIASGGCPVLESNTVSIFINPSISNNELIAPAAVEKCGAPFDPTSISGSDPTGGDGGNYAYQWQMSSNGGTYGNVAGTGRDYNPANITVAGSYDFVRITTSGGCTSTSAPINFLITPNIFSNSLAGIPNPLCEGADPANIVGSTPTGGAGAGTIYYNWEIDNGSGWMPISGAAGQSYDSPVLAPGSYVIQRFVNSAACHVAGNSVSIDITPALSANSLALAPLSYCGTTNVANIDGTAVASSANTATYAWTVNGSGVAASEDYDPPTAYTAGTYTVVRTATYGGCTNSASLTITINNTLSASISAPAAICEGSNAVLTASGGTNTYIWTGGGTQSGALNGTNTAAPTVATTYTVQASNAAGCTGSTQVTIAVRPLPITIISGPNSVCRGQSISITGGLDPSGGVAPSQFAWSGGTISGALNAITTISPTVNTTYTVIGTDANGCTSSKLTEITIDDLPAPSISANALSCTNPTSVLSTGSFISYAWQAGTGGTLFGPSSNATGIATSAGIYTVAVTNVAGCTNTASFSLAGTTAPSGNVYLSDANDNNIALSIGCDNNGWSYYARPADNDKLLFAIEWGAANAFAKANATVRLYYDTDHYQADDADERTVTMRRYWNVDLANGATLASPVNLRFYYDPNEKDEIEYQAQNNLSSTQLAGGAYEGFMWFKTLGQTFDPATSVTASSVNNSIPLLNYTYGIDNSVTYVELLGIGSFSGGTGVAGWGPHSTPLPIKLTAFYGKVNTHQNELYWTTATEQNTLLHLVERSENGISDWSEVGRVRAAGNSSTPRNYTLSDEKPLTRAYYRLRTIDFDGSESFSTIINLERKRSDFGFVNVYPNPTSNTVRLDFQSTTRDPITLQVVDELGRLVDTKTLQVNLGYNTTSIDLTAHVSGVYMVLMNNGTHRTMVKIVKVD